MKKYTNNTRVGLLIGLLSFNALFACVHTRQELGGHKCNESWKKNTLVRGLHMIADSSAGFGTNIKGNQTDGLIRNNNNSTTTIALRASLNDHTGTIPGTNVTLPYNMTTTDVERILNAISENPEYLVRNKRRFNRTTNEKSNSGLESLENVKSAQNLKFINEKITDDRMKTRIFKAIFEHPKNLAHNKIRNKRGYDSVANKDLKVINEKIADDILKHDFSTENLTYWLDLGPDQGLDPNAIGPKTGCYILGLAIVRGKIDAVRLLLARGANPNVEGLHGHTPLMMSVLSVLSNRITEDVAKDIIQLLIDHHADPCIENSRGSTVASCINNVNRYHTHNKEWDRMITKLDEEIKPWQCSTPSVNRKAFC